MASSEGRLGESHGNKVASQFPDGESSPFPKQRGPVDEGGYGDILDGQAKGLKDSNFFQRRPALLCAFHQFAELRGKPRLRSPYRFPRAAQVSAFVKNLLPRICHDPGTLKASWIQSLLAARIGSDAAYMRSGFEPGSFDYRAGSGGGGNDQVAVPHCCIDRKLRAQPVSQGLSLACLSREDPGGTNGANRCRGFDLVPGLHADPKRLPRRAHRGEQDSPPPHRWQRR